MSMITDPTQLPVGALTGEVVDAGTENEFLFFTGRRWTVELEGNNGQPITVEIGGLQNPGGLPTYQIFLGGVYTDVPLTQRHALQLGRALIQVASLVGDYMIEAKGRELDAAVARHPAGSQLRADV